MRFGSSIRDLLGDAPDEAHDADARDAAEARNTAAADTTAGRGAPETPADPGVVSQRPSDGPASEETMMERHDMDEAATQGAATGGMATDRQLSTADVARAAAPAAEAPAAPDDAGDRPARMIETAPDERAQADRFGDGQSPSGQVPSEQAQNAAPSSGQAPGGPDDRQESGERPAPLFPSDQASSLREKWTDLQAGFVDEPRRAVQDADGLVAEVIQRLAQSFADERSQLERQWDGGGDVSTEELRVALRRYRSFFDRLLSL